MSNVTVLKLIQLAPNSMMTLHAWLPHCNIICSIAACVLSTCQLLPQFANEKE